MEFCEHGYQPELCQVCRETNESIFIAVEGVNAYAARLQEEHPDWVVINLGWGVNAYNPNEPQWDS